MVAFRSGMDMRSLRERFLGVLCCALTLVLGCGDDTELGGTGVATETGTTSDDASTTQQQPTTNTHPETTNGTDDPSDSSPETSTTDTDADTDDTDDPSSDTTGEPAWGTCEQGCSEPADCCPAIGGGGCPDEGPNEWTCTEAGVCERIGCTEDSHCEDLLPPPLGMDLRCRQVDGIGECVLPCSDDINCQSLTGHETCSGVADDNSTYCAEVDEDDTDGDTDGEEGCREHADCDGLGLCDLESGECYCTESIDCTDEMFDTCLVR
jgi:hypothetical protein